MLPPTPITPILGKIIGIACCLMLLNACGGGDTTDPKTNPKNTAPTIKLAQGTSNEIIIESPVATETASYQVYISTSDSFADENTEIIDIDTNKYSLEKDDPGKTYYIQVKNKADDEISEIFPITLPLISPSAIEINKQDQVVTLSWPPVKNAVSYSVYRDTQAVFNQDSATLVEISEPTYTINESVTESVTYHYWIAAVYENGSSMRADSLSVTLAPQIILNGPPSFSVPATINTTENQSSIIELTANDPENEAIVFTISGSDKDMFQINSATQELHFVEAPDAEAPKDNNADNTYQITLTASDTSGNDQAQAVDIVVSSVNEAPSYNSADTRFSVAENQAFSRALAATDPEGDTISFTLNPTADYAFFRMEADGKTLALNNPLDFETPQDADKDNQYELNLTLSDGQNQSNQSIIIEVLAVNESAPKFKTATAFKVLENTTAPLQVNATDEDNQPVSYAITNGADKDRFAIDATSGRLTFNELPDFETALDADKNNIYQLTIQADDGEKQSTQNISITVENAKNQFNVKLEPIIFAGDTAQVNAELSVGGETADPIVSYLWEQIISENSPVITLNNAHQAIATFTAPRVTENAPLGLKLTTTTAKNESQSINLYSVIKPFTGQTVGPISHEFPSRVLSKILGNALYFDVQIKDDVAYVANGRGLQLIDITDAEKPLLLENVHTLGDASGVAITDTHAYIADGWQGLQIIGISDDRQAPELLGRIALPGYAQSVKIDNTYAYVASGSSGLHIIDVSNENEPFIVTRFNTPDYTYDVVVANSLAYLANDSSGLQIVDITDSQTPTAIGEVNTNGEAHGLFVVDTLVYVANQANGLRLVDASNPAEPKLIGRLNTSGKAYAVNVVDDIAYVADNNGGLQLIDVSVVNSPTLIKRFDTPGFAYNVAVSDSIVYVADFSAGLQVIDTHDRQNPVLLSNVATSDFAKGVTDANSIAYVADRDSGLHLIDISNNEAPLVIASINTPGSANAVTLVGSRVYIADGSKGLQIINVNDIKNPFIEGSLDTPGDAADVLVVDSIAYVADSNRGLQIIDVSDPENPLRLSEVRGTYANSVAIADTTAFIADRDNGLQIINISDPSSPEKTASLKIENAIAKDVAVVGNIAYLATDNGLHLINIENQNLPVLISTVELPLGADSVTVINSIAYAADSYGGFDIISVVDASAPMILGKANNSVEAVSVSLVGSVAYVAGGLDGLQLVDVSHPETSAIAVNLDMTGQAQAIAVDESIAYIAAGDSGLHIANIDKETAPQLLTSINTLGNAMDVAIVDTVAYVADGENGLQLIDITAALSAGPLGVFDLADADLTEASINKVAVVNSIAFVTFTAYDRSTNKSSGLLAIDVNEPSAPTLLGKISFPDNETAQDIAVIDSTAFVTFSDGNTERNKGSEGGLHLIDVSQPRTPLMMNSVSTPGNASGLTVNNAIAYVNYEAFMPNQAFASGLQLIDVSNILAPTIISRIKMLGSAQGIMIDNGLAYIATGYSGLTIIDVSEPKKPQLLDTIDTFGFASDVVIANNKAYITNGSEGLFVLGFADLENTYSFGLTSDNLSYQVTLDVPNEISQLEAKCWVSGGFCNVQGIDNVNNNATINWQLPTNEGEHEIVFGIGTKDLFLTQKDHVATLAGLSIDTITGIWEISSATDQNESIASFIRVKNESELIYYYDKITGCANASSKIESMETNDLGQQIAQHDEIRLILSNNDELTVIYATNAVASYQRASVISGGCN